MVRGQLNPTEVKSETPVDFNDCRPPAVVSSGYTKAGQDVFTVNPQITVNRVPYSELGLGSGASGGLGLGEGIIPWSPASKAAIFSRITDIL